MVTGQSRVQMPALLSSLCLSSGRSLYPCFPLGHTGHLIFICLLDAGFLVSPAHVVFVQSRYSGKHIPRASLRQALPKAVIPASPHHCQSLCQTPFGSCCLEGPEHGYMRNIVAFLTKPFNRNALREVQGRVIYHIGDTQ